MLLLFLFVVVLLLQLFYCVHCGEVGKFVWFSDFHYDPYYGTNMSMNYYNKGCNTSTSSVGQFSCDSPLSLIKDAVLSAQVHHVNLLRSRFSVVLLFLCCAHVSLIAFSLLLFKLLLFYLIRYVFI
eukprot:m.77656 g.77656  ORF g.77656 m.77656 type:complete len:126 (-) comp11926_c1_seq1:1245-1622(-)